MKNVLFRSALLASLCLAVFSCKKEDVADSEEYDVALETSGSESAMNEADDEAMMRVAGPDGAGDCATISFSAPEGTYPNTMTIDFGETGCEGLHGHIKTGKIIVEMSADRLAEGSVHTISFDNLKVDGNAVEGVKTITNMGENDEGYLWFTVTVRGGSITFEDGSTATFESDRVRVMKSGEETPEREDDSFEIRGSGSGVNRRGNSFTMLIAEALVHNAGCRWPVSGVIEGTCSGGSGEGSGERTRSIDFGDGACDDLATVTTPRGTKEIHLRR